MSGAVLDASAVLALLVGDPGADKVRARLAGAVMSAANYAEVVAGAAALCGSLDEARRRIDRQRVTVVPLDAAQAAAAAALAPAGEPIGLSLADRCCLALGLIRGSPVLTADRDWKSLDIGVTIVLIR